VHLQVALLKVTVCSAMCDVDRQEIVHRHPNHLKKMD
jgi:hypothetical protein